MSNPGWAIASTIAVVVFAERATARVALPTWPARVAGFFVLAYADVVLSAEILGCAGLIRPQWFVLLQLLIAAIAAWSWRGYRSPRFMPVWDLQLGPVFRQHQALGVLAIVIVLAYAVNAVLVVTLPPNNWDSMMYHLSRVGYWLQRARFYPPWNPEHMTQTFHPINAELGVLWTMVFWGSDRLAGMVQWVAALILMIVIIGLARLLGYSRAAGVFAAFVWASLPQVLLQSTTTQTDLVGSVFVAAGAYLSALGLLARHRGALVLSGISIGLAFGTKTTAIMALPAVALGGAIVWARTGRNRLLGQTWLVATACAILLLGVQQYVANWIVSGHPLGSSRYRSLFANGAPTDPAVLAANGFKIGYAFVDLSGLPSGASNPLLAAKVAIGRTLTRWLGIDPQRDAGAGSPLAIFAFEEPPRLHEDLSYFGPLGFLFVIPVALWRGLRGARRGHGLAFALLATAIWFTAVITIGVRWHPWLGRYFILAMTFCAPLLAGFYRPGRTSVALVVGLAVLVTIRSGLFNEAKPLSGTPSIWGRDRIGVRALAQPPVEPPLRMFEREVGETARVGLILKGVDWDYPLFGDHLSRTLVPLYPRPTVVTEDLFATYDLDFVLVNTELPTDTTAIAQRARTWTAPPWLLIARQPVGE